MLAELLGDSHAVAREQLDLFLGRLVGAEQTVIGIVAAAVHGSGQKVVKPEDNARTRLLQKPLGALARMDIAGNDGVRIVEQRGHAVAEDQLRFRAGFRNDIGVK